VVYQRNKDRMVLDPDVVTMNLHERLGPKWNISMVMHREEADPCSIWASLWNVDLLLTPHGFQSILLLFMPKGSAIFEVFPYKYWKEGYRPFANEYGLWHGWSQNKRATTWYRDFVLSFISQVCGWGVYCYDFLVLPIAPSVSCSCVDALNTPSSILPPSPSVSRFLQSV
jgi:hypothetical protein